MKLLPSKKQELLLEFIDSFIKEHNFSPSYREVMLALGYKSVSTVAKHIDGLIDRGWLVKRENSKRSLEVVYQPAGNGAGKSAAVSPAPAPRASSEDLQQRLAAAAALVMVGAEYAHYKGGTYRVIDLAIQTVDDEVCVIYKAQYGAGLTFVRPLTEWREQVQTENGPVGRFQIIEKTETADAPAA